MQDSSSELFPYEHVRAVQDRLMKNVALALEEKKNLVVHAPTGLGKTAAALSPALAFALKHDLKVLFLTSRHTQHHLAIETLRDIQAAHKTGIKATDIIGKKWMCTQPGASKLYSGEFAEFCKKMREDGTCEFYANTRDGFRLKPKSLVMLAGLSKRITHTEELIRESRDEKLCAYEVSLEHAGKSDVIIADYYYVFHPNVSEMFLKRAGIDISQCILIVDEAHNLPNRIRDLATTRLSGSILRLAIREARKLEFSETVQELSMLGDILAGLVKGLGQEEERLVPREEFITLIEKTTPFKRLAKDLETVADTVRESQRQSHVGSVAGFLQAWQGPAEGFARFVRLTEFRGTPNIVLSNSCLDPSVISRPVTDNAYSSIFMSGTLTPTSMYRDVLGIEDAEEKEFPCPFPEKNRLSIVVPGVTTRFTARSPKQFENIARACAEITNAVPGNSFLFFPSYSLRDRIYARFSALSKKTCFLEKARLTKEEKKELIDNFKKYKDSGAVMLGVASGSFSEGVDLPGDLLKCVVIVGLPLVQPDLETKELISYYEKKFSRGWDYGYIFPAFNRSLQSAGRCIRSGTDRGVVAFLDERYLWPRYSRLFPDDWDMVVAKDYVERIEEFFSQNR